jgi:hypothetical protein
LIESTYYNGKRSRDFELCLRANGNSIAMAHKPPVVWLAKI